MKLRSYGIVIFTLIVGALALPTNLELSKEVAHQDTRSDTTVAKVQENESKATLMNEIETLKIEDTSTMKVKFPQITDKAAISEENEMEITPRILGCPEYQDKHSMEKENEQETQIIIKKESVEENEVTKKPLESTQDEGLEFQAPASNAALLEMLKKCQSEKVVASNPPQNFEGMRKPTDNWNDFEDSKYSLLEDRLPDLTDEEFREINKADSIPLNFLKQLDITKKEIKDNNLKLDGLKQEKPKVEPKLETPVYITIPIVINSLSNLPISLSIGGHTVPLDAVNKMAHTVTPPPKTLDKASPSSRETNRHRNNIRS